MSAPAYVDRNFNCIPNCGSPDGCVDGVCKAMKIIDASPPPDPALALLREAREWLWIEAGNDKKLCDRIDAHFAARAHLKERGDE